MHRCRPLFLLALAFAWAGTAHAAGADEAAFNTCMTQAGGVTAAMHDCIGQDLRAQDARLNAAYTALRAGLGSRDRREALQRAQRDWVRFRDSNCGYRMDPAGGTLAGVAAGDCKRRMTRERAAELEALRTPR